MRIVRPIDEHRRGGGCASRALGAAGRRPSNTLGRAVASSVVAAALSTAVPADAQDVVLTGTLKAIQDRGAILIGVRQGAVPFSFRNKAGQPVGFSVDICRRIAADAAQALSQPLVDPENPDGPATGLKITYVPVSADARIPMVEGGEVDLECGSTTATAARAKEVAFSPVFFLAGTRLLVPKDSAINSYRDVKTVAVSTGTTNAEVMKRLAASATPPFQVMEAPGVPEAFDMLAAGKVDAVASDDVLLAGLVAARPDGASFRLAGEFLSFEPYAIALRRDDPQFAALVQASFGRMAADGTLQTRYRRWFTDPLPDGHDLDLPMSAQLTEMYRALGQPD